jgi:hypothetical protein
LPIKLVCLPPPPPPPSLSSTLLIPRIQDNSEDIFDQKNYTFETKVSGLLSMIDDLHTDLDKSKKLEEVHLVPFAHYSSPAF